MSGRPRFAAPGNDIGWKGTIKKENAAVFEQQRQTALATSGSKRTGDTLDLFMSQHRSDRTEKEASLRNDEAEQARIPTAQYRSVFDGALDRVAGDSYFKGPLDGSDGDKNPRGTLMKKRSGTIVSSGGGGNKLTAEESNAGKRQVQSDTVVCGSNTTSNKSYGWTKDETDVKGQSVGAKKGPWFGLQKSRYE